MIRLNGADYVTVRKMTVHATNTRYACAIRLTSAADHNTITNNVLISNNNRGASYDSYLLEGTVVYGQSAYNNFSNNHVSGGTAGIILRGTSGSYRNGNTIVNNQIENNIRYGISTLYHDSPLIKGNLVKSNRGDTYYIGIEVKNSRDTIRVLKNKVDLIIGRHGIVMNWNYCSSSQRSLVANNFIHCGSSNTREALYITSCRYQDVYHNSVNVTAGGNYSIALSVVYGINGNNVRLLNNILANTGGGYAINVDNSGLVTQSEHITFTPPALTLRSGPAPTAMIWQPGNRPVIEIQPLYP